MNIPSKVYDVIKYALCIAIPAIVGALTTLTAYFGWTWGDAVITVINTAQILIAALFCISIAGYTPTVVKADDTVSITDAANTEVK